MTNQAYLRDEIPPPFEDGGLDEIDTAIEGVRREIEANPLPRRAPDPLLTLPAGWAKQAGGPAFFTPTQKQTKGAEDVQPVRVSGPFDVIGEVDSGDGTGCGLLLRWRVRDTTRQRIVNRGELEGRGTTVAALLRSEGVEIASGQAARFEALLVDVKHDRFIQAVDRAGFHKLESGAWAYVTPEGQIVGAKPDSIALRGVSAMDSATGGSLGDWQDRIAALAVGNSRLTLGLSVAFAGYLLDIAGATSVGVGLVGKSQSGKSTIANAAASVVGPLSRVRSWRASCNGLEGAASLSSDCLMVLDELQSSDPREAADATYALFNGQGKSRAHRDGSARAVATWRVAVVSTSEVPLAQHIATAGRASMSGHDVRLIDLPVQATQDAAMGAWEHLHGHPGAREFADAITAAARENYGMAGLAFVEHLLADRNADAEALRERVVASREAFIASNVPTGADGQVRSVAAKLGLLAAAGALATDYGIVPWPEGAAEAAAKICFAAWLDQRGGSHSGEDRRILEAARACIAFHGTSRFAELFPSGRAEAKVRDQIGWRREVSLGGDSFTEFLVTPESLKRFVFAGMDPARAARVLADHGYLRMERGAKHLTVRENLQPLGRTRVYAISSRIME